MIKACGHCKELLLYDMFAKHKGLRLGVESICKVCKSKHTQRWDANNKDKKKNSGLKRYYWTTELFNQVIKIQHGLCYICDVNLTIGSVYRQSPADTMACADHDHLHKSPRAILCNACNILEAQLRKKPQFATGRMLDFINTPYNEFLAYKIKHGIVKVDVANPVDCLPSLASP